jgi:hypothetical protein
VGALILRKGSERRPALPDRPRIRWHDVFHHLWLHDEKQLDELRQSLYGALHKRAAEVFPLRFEVDEGLLTDKIAGELRGFQL